MKVNYGYRMYNPNYYKYNHNPSFGTNGRVYKSQYGVEMGTMTYPFRSDIDWKKLTEYMIRHFKNKDKVNIVQFASSDGSEAYSQIISFLERGKNEDIGKFFPIYAYDIDEEIIKAAQSGLLNIHPENMEHINHNCKDYTEYFKKSSKNLEIKNNVYDLFQKKYTTYAVSEDVKKKVIFKQADMFDILVHLEDDSNTVLMCRNVLGYFSDRVIKNTVEMVSRKLKKDSLFIIGKIDTDSWIKNYLKANNFREIIKNVFLKIA